MRVKRKRYFRNNGQKTKISGLRGDVSSPTVGESILPAVRTRSAWVNEAQL